MYFFAGHGVQDMGQQTLVINEYDKGTTFYKLWRVEAMIRMFAALFPRSYHFAIYAACREIYVKASHSGGVAGPKYEDAVAKFKAIEQDEEAAKEQVGHDLASVT